MPVQQAWDYAIDSSGARWVRLSDMREVPLYAFGPAAFRANASAARRPLLRIEAIEPEPFLAAMIASYGGELAPLIDEFENMLAGPRRGHPLPC
jgi:hypothetical protein